MSIRPILHYPDERVRKVAEPVERITEDLLALLDDMIETMYDAPGVGLAAPQIGVSKRVAVIDISSGKEPGALIVMINPEIISADYEETAEEGCLSVPDFSETVTRARKLEVRFMNRNGEEVTLSAEGLLARAVQHEVDHLNGTLFIDHLPAVKKDVIKRKIKKAIREGHYRY